MTASRPDPFAGGVSAPALSFDGKPFGTAYLCTVTSLPDLVHSTNYETKQKDYWPADANGVRNPKMSAVINVTISGQPFSIWAAKPSALFAAIAEAQQTAGQQIDVGGTLLITYTHDQQAKGGAHLNPAKQYSVVYTPPANGGAFATTATISTLPPQAAPLPTPAPQPTPLPTPAPVPSPAPQPVAPAAAARPAMTPEQVAALIAAGLDPATVAAAQAVS